MPPSTDLDAWKQSAERWVRDADHIEKATEEATEALLAALCPKVGQTVLDVACGPGDPSLRIAERVGPSGRVEATDGVGAMIEALIQRAAARGIENVHGHVMEAEELTLADDLADCACCRFGTMFFADPQAALTNMGRIVRPGGRIVLVVWGPGTENPFFLTVGQALDDAGAPALPETFGTRTVFEYAEPGVLAAMARSVGWTDVTDTHVDITMTEQGVTPENLLETRREASDRVAWRLDRLAPETREAVRAAVATAVAPYARGADLAFPASIRVVAGRAP